MYFPDCILPTQDAEEKLLFPCGNFSNLLMQKGLTLHFCWAACINNDIYQPSQTDVYLHFSFGAQFDFALACKMFCPVNLCRGFVPKWVLLQNYDGKMREKKVIINRYWLISNHNFSVWIIIILHLAWLWLFFPIHTFCVLSIFIRVAGELWPIPADFWQDVGYTLDWAPANTGRIQKQSYTLIFKSVDWLTHFYTCPKSTSMKAKEIIQKKRKDKEHTDQV